MLSVKSALLLLVCVGFCSQCLACTDHNGGEGGYTGGESSGGGSSGGGSSGGGSSTPYTYIGCYRDQAVRDLQRMGPVAHMSSNRCYHECKRWGFKYFGLQYTYYCFCGNVYGAYGKVEDRECNMRCDGNKSEWCGGLWKNSVYEIHE